MRDLARPEVLRSAIIAAFLSALAGCPRLLLWTGRPHGLAYMETLLFLCGAVLWGFVFAWHTKYTKRPLFPLWPGWLPFTVATVCGVAGGVTAHFWADPVFRKIVPIEYPETLAQWFALVLWTLGFLQLGVLFAPFAWLMRLSRHVGVATVGTVLFGAFVMIVKNHSSPTPMPWDLLVESLARRLVGGLLAVYLLLRGGVPLVWWWALLFQSRHLWTILAAR